MFSISIEQKVLAAALNFLSSTVGKNTQNLGDNCISIKTSGKGSVIMYTTNTIEFTEVEAIVTLGGNTVEQCPYVDFNRFKQMISTIPETENVSIQANLNNIVISYALMKNPITLVGDTNGMIPSPTSSFKKQDTISLPKGIVGEALNGACGVINESIAMPIFNCMRIATQNQNIDITAIDAISKRTYALTSLANCNNMTTEVLIEAGKFKKAFKIFEDFAELDFNMDNSIVCVEGSVPVSPSRRKYDMITNVKYYACRISGTFPNNIKQNMYPLPTEFAEVDKDELISALLRVKVLEDNQSGGCFEIAISDQTMKILKLSTYGSTDFPITLENKITKPITQNSFKFNSFNDIIKTMEGNVEIGVLPKHPDVLMIKQKNNDYQLFTLPCVVNNTTP